MNKHGFVKDAYKYEKLYDKEADKLDKTTGFKDISKEIQKKMKIQNIHDRQANEMRADNFAIKNTSGNNNSNRLKKSLNEIWRRDIQKQKDNLNKDHDNSNRDYNELINSNITKLNKFKLISRKKSYDKAYKDEMKNADIDYKSISNTRKKVNDYIQNKQKKNKNDKPRLSRFIIFICI